MKRLVVLGTGIDPVTLDEATDYALCEMRRRRGSYVVTPNAEMLLCAERNPGLRAALEEAALSLPDGVGVTLAARLSGISLTERVPGVDFARRLLAGLNGVNGRVFLLGAAPGVAAQAAGRLKNLFPELEIVGWQHGFFKAEDEPALIDRINVLSPDFLIVCLGSPKQELWMHAHSAQLNVGLMAGLGGALDIFARRLPRAPRWMRRAGLEWLFRLLIEPRRFTRMIGIPILFIKAFHHRIGGSRKHG